MSTGKKSRPQSDDLLYDGVGVLRGDSLFTTTITPGVSPELLIGKTTLLVL